MPLKINPGIFTKHPPAVQTRLIIAHAIGLMVESQDKIDQALVKSGFLQLKELRDKSFCRLVTLATLRHWGQIRQALLPYIKKPIPAVDAVVYNIIASALAQVIILKTPPHAVVHTAVEAVKVFYHLRKYQGFVNAILQKWLRDHQSGFNLPDAQFNYPNWLLQSWSSLYGSIKTDKIISSFQQEPMLHLSIKNQTEYWAMQLQAKHLTENVYYRQTDGDISHLPGYHEGAWWIQNAAATLPASLLHIQPGERVLDLCAAPGGKTAQLAATGAFVTAVDNDGVRLNILQQNMRRLGLEADIVQADVCAWRPSAPAHYILLDAPCSATGTLRRHPEIAWRRTLNDIDRLVGQQRQLLQSAYHMLAPGGKMIYATCSLQPEEGEQQIEWFLATYPEIRIDPIRPAEPNQLQTVISDQGTIRTMPYDHPEAGGLDGFFIARLQRV